MPEGLRDIDANLLLPLYALLQERNLTHAGDRIALSQPAMSGALARLRRHFGDDLLVRTAHGFELTPLAERLGPAVAEAVAFECRTRWPSSRRCLPTIGHGRSKRSCAATV